jgi:hypothetical protein
MFDMLLICGTVYQNIIEKHNNELPQTISKGSIHGTLKYPRSPRKTKSQHPKLELAEVSLKGCFEFLSWLEEDLVETGVQIQIGEPRCLAQFIQQLVKHWNWILGFKG